MKKLRAMLYGACALIIASITTTPLIAGSSDFAGPYIAIEGIAMGVELDGKHQDEDGAVTKGTGGKVFPVLGLELGYNIPVGDVFFLSIGGSYISESAEISKADDAADAADVTLKVNKLWTGYLAPSISVSDNSSVFLKAGYTAGQLTATGNITGDINNLSGYVVGIGTSTIFESGVFIRSEAGMAEFDKISVTGIGGSANAILTADPSSAYGKVSLGYKF